MFSLNESGHFNFFRGGDNLKPDEKQAGPRVWVPTGPVASPTGFI
jgi:hypothetical protein